MRVALRISPQTLPDYDIQALWPGLAWPRLYVESSSSAGWQQELEGAERRFF